MTDLKFYPRQEVTLDLGLNEKIVKVRIKRNPGNGLSAEVQWAYGFRENVDPAKLALLQVLFPALSPESFESKADLYEKLPALMEWTIRDSIHWNFFYPSSSQPDSLVVEITAYLNHLASLNNRLEADGPAKRWLSSGMIVMSLLDKRINNRDMRNEVFNDPDFRVWWKALIGTMIPKVPEIIAYEKGLAAQPVQPRLARLVRATT